MFKRLNRKGQSMVEYAMIFAAVAGVVIGVQAYVRANLQGKITQAVDLVGTDVDPSGNPYAVFENPSEYAHARDDEVTAVQSTWSQTPQQRKSLEVTDVDPTGITKRRVEEVSEVQGAVRKSIY